MKKFLFTLAALMMAGSAFAANYLYIDDIQLTQEFVEQSSAKARQVDVAVKAHFDQWTSAWDVTFDFGEIISRGTVKDENGNVIAPDMVLQGMDMNGGLVNIPVALNANAEANHFIAANSVGGYYYPEGSDPDEDDPVFYGAVKWAPGDYECMFMLTLRFPQYFEGGDITISTTCASGTDARPGVETAPKNVTDTYVAHVTVEGGAQPEVTATPVINWDEETFTVSATGAGTVKLYVNGEEVSNPYTFELGEEETTYTVTATAQEEGKEISETATLEVTVPGKAEPYETPAPEVTTDLNDDALVITATGEGTVTVYVQTIDNETGEMTVETYEGEGTVTVEVPRGDEAYFINYWAVAQADEDAVPGSTQVAYFVEVPAKEVTPVDPSHEQGVWIVTFLAGGEEFWQEMLPSNEDYTCIVRFSYGNYGTFPYDPNKSMAENDAMRPDMPFYIVIDGVRYGAAEDGTLCVLGTALSNELFENENLYVLEHALGRVYNMGVAIDELDPSKKYVYAAVAAYTEVEEMNASKTVAGVRYFNMAGQEMQEANGMTIVVTTYTDGTTSAVKVMK